MNQSDQVYECSATQTYCRWILQSSTTVSQSASKLNAVLFPQEKCNKKWDIKKSMKNVGGKKKKDLNSNSQ